VGDGNGAVRSLPGDTVEAVEKHCALFVPVLQEPASRIMETGEGLEITGHGVLQTGKLLILLNRNMSMMSGLAAKSGFLPQPCHNPEQRNHFSFAYSAFAAFKMGISGSASFQSVRKS
jgi:hypothetical protein